MFHFIESLPISEENLIITLRIAGIAFGFLAVMLLFHAINLSNALSVVKAKQLINNENFTIVTLTEANMPVFEVPQRTSVTGPKIVSFTISEESQQLLDKLSVNISYENGWRGSTEL